MSKSSDRRMSFDCRYFLGDRPCKWHKAEKVICECKYYDPVSMNILIIKLDAMGDVLRTTCLLPPIKHSWPDSKIVWITRSESYDLLVNNPYIDEIFCYGPDALVQLGSREFDIAINLDAGMVSSSMTTIARAKNKYGYVLDKLGFVRGTNAEAEHWQKLGVFDDLKKENTDTYQKIMCSIIGLPDSETKYVLSLTDQEIMDGRKYLKEIGLDLDKKILGIHAGAGERWPLKRWRIDGYVGLISEMKKEFGNELQICLLGGPKEVAINKSILENIDTGVFNLGCDKGVRQFASIVSGCTVVLSGDSLAMHVAVAMDTRVVVLFGPTSYSEVDLYGLGEKIFPDLNCLVCYKGNCEKKPNCMQAIGIETVKQAVIRQLSMAG